MTKYRFYYWFNTLLTECYIKADNEKEAIEIFNKRHGSIDFVSVEECTD